MNLSPYATNYRYGSYVMYRGPFGPEEVAVEENLGRIPENPSVDILAVRYLNTDDVFTVHSDQVF